MKKKSPPYAIIGAAVLGLIAVYAFVTIERAKDKAAADAVEKQRLADQAAIDDANKKGGAVVVQSQQTDMRGVLYATQPVQPGQKLSPAFYESKLTPSAILPDAFNDKTDITGWYAVRAIEKGDPLTPRNIGKVLPTLATRISLGMRAVSLPIFNGDVNNTGGFIVDGDKVDLLYTSVGANGLETRTIMQNVKVLYVPGPTIKTDQTDGVNPVPTPGSTVAVTFEVTPETAQALINLSLVQTPISRFSMILRARRDDGETPLKPYLAADYAGNLKKIQRTTDLSTQRVQELAAEIEAKEKTQAAQGTTNETTTPTPPSP